MSKIILYIGNKLSKHGNTPTSVETLGELLNKDYNIISVSDKKNKIFRLFDMLYSIVSLRSKISLILIDTYSTSNFYYAYLCSVFANILSLKYIPILHGGALPQRLQRNPKMCKYIFSNSKINIAPSGYLVAKFDEHGYKTQFIPNNINISNYNYKERKNIKLKLLYVRAIGKQYNPQLAIRVVKALQMEYPDVELCMIGPDRDGTINELKTMVKDLALENNVSFTGKLTKKEWIKLSQEYDIFINTTNVDNTPVSIIEAMALGFPIVSTNVGGLPYLIDDEKDGLLVNVNDCDDMVEKIKYIYENSEVAHSLSVCARKKAESFDWENVKESWKKSIDSIIK